MKFSFDLKEFKCVTEIEIRFSDLDAMGHVNNATYLSYLEEARIDYFENALGPRENNLDFGAVVAGIDISYLRPLELGDKVKIFSKMFEIGRKSFDLRHVIQGEREGKIFTAALAATKLVAYDYKKKESLEIPEETKRTIWEFEGKE